VFFVFKTLIFVSYLRELATSFSTIFRA
jgi:hypothetical protein